MTRLSVPAMLCVAALLMTRASHAEPGYPSSPPPPPPPSASDPPPSAQTSGPFDRPGHIGIGLEASDIGFGGTLKFFLPGPLAIQGFFGLGYADGFGYGFTTSVDLLYEARRFLSVRVLSMNWYVGGGLTAGLATFVPGSGSENDPFFGFQAVGGVGLQFRQVPIEVTGEFRPTFIWAFAPDGVYFGPAAWGFAIAGRYFF